MQRVILPKTGRGSRRAQSRDTVRISAWSELASESQISQSEHGHSVRISNAKGEQAPDQTGRRSLPAYFCDIFFLKNTSRAIVHHRPIRIENRQWPSAAKDPSAGRRWPPRWNPRVALRAARPRIAGGRRRGSAVAHTRARRGARRATHSADHRRGAGEPRDRPGRRLRPVADRSYQRIDERCRGSGTSRRWTGSSDFGRDHRIIAREPDGKRESPGNGAATS